MSVRLAKPLSVTSSAIHMYERVSFLRVVVPAYHRLRLRAVHANDTRGGGIGEAVRSESVSERRIRFLEIHVVDRS